MSHKTQNSSSKKTSKPAELSSDENLSPVRKTPPANSMMMNWLKQSASKKTSDEKESKPKEVTEVKKKGETDKKADEPVKKSQYFGNNAANKKNDDEEKIMIKSKKKEEKVSVGGNEKRSPKNDLKKKVESKSTASFIVDSDEDEDDFIATKKSKSSKPSKPTTPTKPVSKADSSKPEKAAVEKKTTNKKAVVEDEEPAAPKKTTHKKAVVEEEEPAPQKKTIHKKVVVEEEEPHKKSATGSAKKTGGNKYYAAYMRRDGPKNPGSKPIPIGKKDCFAGLKFLVTGVLESLERDDCKTIVEKYGGSMISGVTKKLDYLIIGEDAGEAKLKKADELNVKKVNEDEFLQLICTKSGIKEPKYENEAEQAMEVEEEVVEAKKEKTTPVKKAKDEAKKDEKKNEKNATKEKTDIKKAPETIKKSPLKSEPIKKEADVEKKEPVSDPNELWVDKYKPKSMAKIIGQIGEKSNANKLLKWLKNWNTWHLEGSDKKKPWNDQENGSSFKCALLSGPPGIGKTTTATLTCKEAGYTYIELNASDSRSKRLLDKILGESTESGSIDSYMIGKHRADDLSKDKHCIIMDEVDGMAGNEDRGGVQELIAIIKSSKIPIICICNDRQHPKMRTLANYCFDLRFYKPRLEQVRAAMASICFKEGIKITNELLDQIIVACNYDIRQCLYNLSVWSSNNKNFVSSKSTTNDIEKAIKDVKMNPFEACRQVFHRPEAGSNKPPLSIMDRCDLFFTDYSLMPLLVQENYLSVHPSNLESVSKPKRIREHLEVLTETVESLIESDRVGRLIRTNNNWSLLTTQAVFTTLIPGQKLAGSMGLPAFPSWFGKNSKQGRVDRILQELQKHMRIHISANKLGVGMDYLSVLKRMLTKPLIKKGADGIPTVINLMNEYSLTREDFDTIVELATWPNQKDVMSEIDSKVKASFTRAFNKESHLNPFTMVNVKKLKTPKLTDDQENPEEEENDEDDEEKDTIAADAMIKVKNTAKKTAAKTATKQTTATKRPAKSREVDDARPKDAKKKKI